MLLLFIYVKGSSSSRTLTLTYHQMALSYRDKMLISINVFTTNTQIYSAQLVMLMLFSVTRINFRKHFGCI